MLITSAIFGDQSGQGSTPPAQNDQTQDSDETTAPEATGSEADQAQASEQSETTGAPSSATTTNDAAEPVATVRDSEKIVAARTADDDDFVRRAAEATVAAAQTRMLIDNIAPVEGTASGSSKSYISSLLQSEAPQEVAPKEANMAPANKAA
jgi:hypothetical protein